MKTKRKASPTASVPASTWILFGIFLIVSAFCFKIIKTAQEVSDSILTDQPVQVIVVTRTPTKSVSRLK